MHMRSRVLVGRLVALVLSVGLIAAIAFFAVTSGTKNGARQTHVESGLAPQASVTNTGVTLSLMSESSNVAAPLQLGTSSYEEVTVEFKNAQSSTVTADGAWIRELALADQGGPQTIEDPTTGASQNYAIADYLFVPNGTGRLTCNYGTQPNGPSTTLTSPAAAPGSMAPCLPPSQTLAPGGVYGPFDVYFGVAGQAQQTLQLDWYGPSPQHGVQVTPSVIAVPASS